MTYQTDPAKTAGPTGDGSKSLAKESKVGIAVTVVLSILVTLLTNVDTSHWTGWWASGAGLILSGVIGLISAWLKSNR